MDRISSYSMTYAYVADDFSMNACYLLDLDEERSVSAGEIKQVIGAIKDDGVSVILARSCTERAWEIPYRVRQMCM